MMGELIFAGYAAGYLYTTRKVALKILDSDARHALEMRSIYMHRREERKPLTSTEDRVLALMMGLLVSIVWPVALVVLWVSTWLRAPIEVAEDERRELAALRRQAEELGLPMPGTGDEK
jgi:hypothetical protein